MAFVQTYDKWIATKAFINTWLKDKTIYCGNCDSNYDERLFPCCEEPVLETNFGHTKAIIEAVKDLKKNQLNQYGSNKEMNFRSTVKLPKRLLWDLDKYFKDTCKEALFNNQEEMREFAQRFPQFCVAEKI